jgi:iron complex outermembrane recepter protein
MKTQRALRLSLIRPGQRSSLQLAPSVLRGLAFLVLFAARWAAASSTEPFDNPVKKLTLEQLGNVEVTSVSKEPEEVRNTSAAIYVITQEDIERSGVTNLPDALRLAPGVEVAQIDSSKWSIGIRGFGSRLSRDVLVLIDGRTVYTTLLAGTYWEVQNVLLDDVDRIEIIRGPGGTIWGPNAVNGVINIITKNSKDTHGAFGSVAGGSLEQGLFNARFGGGDDKHFNYRIYALGFDRGPEYHSDGQNFDRWRAAQGGFRTDWAMNNRDTFTLQGDIYDEGAGESVTATSYAQPYQQVIDGTAYLSGGNILGRWQRVFGEGDDFQVQAYYDRTNRREPNFIDNRDTFDVDFLDRFRLPERQQISWGLGARVSLGHNPTVVSGLEFLPTERTDRLFTAFLQDEIGLIDNRLTLSIGTKFLRTNFTALQLEPSGRLLWTPTKNQTWWASFTHALRTPSDAEENFYLLGYIGTGPGNLPYFARFNPNPNFRSEELNGYELGYRQLVGRKAYFDVAAFYNHYSDLFSEDITGPAFVENNPPPTHLLLPADFGNGLLGTTKGIEIAPEWKPFDFWRLGASYSYLQMDLRKSRNSLDVGTGPIIEGSSPRHQATAQSYFDLKKRFKIDLTYRYVSALPAESVSAYSTADARFAWQFVEHFQLSVVGQNLLQPHHYEAGGDPGPLVGIKRSVYGQVTWKR